MNLLKKGVTVALVGSLVVLSNPNPSNAQESLSRGSVEDLEVIELPKLEHDNQVETLSVKKNVLKVLAQVLINPIKKVPINNNPGRVLDHGSFANVTHSSVTFNTGSIGSAVSKDVTGYGQDIIRPFLKRNQLIPGVKGYINVLDANGKLLLSRTVTNGQSIDYKIPFASTSSARKYMIHYGATDKAAWIPAMNFIPYKDYGPVAPISIGVNDLINQDEPYFHNNRVYLKNNAEFNSKLSQVKNNAYTMNNLYLEFYNDENGELTDQAKNLKSGDKVIMKDEITKLEYDLDKDTTIFKFDSTFKDVEFHEIRFKGDLTKEYKRGSRIGLQFDIVSIFNVGTEEFIDLNYNVEFETTDDIPSIDAFILKN